MFCGPARTAAPRATLSRYRPGVSARLRILAFTSTPALGALWGTFAAIRTVKNVERAKRERGDSVQPFSATTRDDGLVVGLAGRF